MDDMRELRKSIAETNELLDGMEKRHRGGRPQPHPESSRKPVTFVTWLISAYKRDDPVGDIARDVIRDRAEGCMPSTLNTFPGVLRHLTQKHAYSRHATPDTHEALYEALADWKREMKARKFLRGW